MSMEARSARGVAGLLLVFLVTGCQGAAGPRERPGAMSGGEEGGDDPTGGGGGAGGSAGKSGTTADAAATGSTGGTGGAPADAAPIEPVPPSPDAAPSPADAGSTPSARTSAACGKGLAAPAEGFHTIKVGARDRRFFLRIPPTYDGKLVWPVIFGFHGAGNKDGSWFDTHTGLRAQNEGHAVLVFGESLYRPGSTTERSWQDEGQLPDNLAYIDATVRWLHENVCFDPRRVFAAGQSSGAYFSQTLGCHRGDVFRAVASSDGGERLFSDCRGYPGAFIRYRPASSNGGADSKRARDFWIKRNECQPGPTEKTDTPPCVAYPGCKDDILLWECLDGGAHDWPTYMDKGVWNFFSKFK